jgi:hypothetical protein
MADECSGRNGKALKNRKYASEEIRSQWRIYSSEEMADMGGGGVK